MIFSHEYKRVTIFQNDEGEFLSGEIDIPGKFKSLQDLHNSIDGWLRQTHQATGLSRNN